MQENEKNQTAKDGICLGDLCALFKVVQSWILGKLFGRVSDKDAEENIMKNLPPCRAGWRSSLPCSEPG